MENAIINGQPVYAIAKEFGVSDDALYNHRDKCVKEAIEAAIGAERVTTGLRLIDRVTRLDELVEGVVSRTLEPALQPMVRADGTVVIDGEGEPRMWTPPVNDRLILHAVREARENAALVAKVLGDLPPENAVGAAQRALADPKAARIAAELEEMLAAAEDAAKTS